MSAVPSVPNPPKGSLVFTHRAFHFFRVLVYATKVFGIVSTQEQKSPSSIHMFSVRKVSYSLIWLCPEVLPQFRAPSPSARSFA